MKAPLLIGLPHPVQFGQLRCTTMRPPTVEGMRPRSLSGGGCCQLRGKRNAQGLRLPRAGLGHMLLLKQCVTLVLLRKGVKLVLS
jgi:hypothetical protein